jgi:hypothetical protein
MHVAHEQINSALLMEGQSAGRRHSQHRMHGTLASLHAASMQLCNNTLQQPSAYNVSAGLVQTMLWHGCVGSCEVLRHVVVTALQEALTVLAADSGVSTATPRAGPQVRCKADLHVQPWHCGQWQQSVRQIAVNRISARANGSVGKGPG